jgi:hypothetical protein
MLKASAEINNLVDKSIKEVLIRIAADKSRMYSITDIFYAFKMVLKEISNSDITKTIDIWNVEDHIHAKAVHEDYMGVTLNLSLGDIVDF